MNKGSDRNVDRRTVCRHSQTSGEKKGRIRFGIDGTPEQLRIHHPALQAIHSANLKFVKKLLVDLILSFVLFFHPDFQRHRLCRNHNAVLVKPLILLLHPARRSVSIQWLLTWIYQFLQRFNSSVFSNRFVSALSPGISIGC